MPSARGNRDKHAAVASKAATSSTLSAYVRQGAQLALGVGWMKSKPKERLGVMRAHERRNLQTRKHAEGAQ